MRKSVLFGVLLSFFTTGYASAVTISGYVRDSRGTAISGVTVYFSDKGGSAVTSKTGYYSHALPLGWYGSYGPSQAGYYFSPASYTHTRGSATTNRNFTRYVQTYTISGYVRDGSGSGIEGVTMTFSNGEGTATTSSTGYYSTVVAYNWSGTVTPSIASHTFSPSSLSFVNVTSSKTNQNFTGTLRTYYILGYVRDGSGNGIEGVTVTFSNGGGTATTSSSGYYYEYVNYGWSGTATPSIASHTFSPSSLSYTSVTSNYTGQDYTGTLKTYTISGSVSSGILPLGCTITFSNGGGTVTVGKTGTYSKTLNHGWSGTVTPSSIGYSFSPSSRSYTGLSASYSNQDFTGTKVTRYISGYVYSPTGQGMEGVTVTFSNSGGTATTNSSGYYYRYLDYGWSGTATPSETGYTFSPGSRTYSNLTSNTSGQNYTAAHITYTVSGYITGGGRVPVGLQGVSVYFSNGGGTALTGKTGYYSKSLNYGYSGTVTPVLAGYTFSPSSRSYSKLAGNVTGEDYDWAVATFTISGTIVDTAGDPVQGVTVTLSNGGGSDITDANGYYAEAVPYGWDGTATPSIASHTFEPASRSYLNVTGNMGTGYYTGTINSYQLKGTVREGMILGGNLMPGPDITSCWVHFGSLDSVFTDRFYLYPQPWTYYTGDFSKNVPHGWSGWVWPGREGYTFFNDYDSVWCENITAPDSFDFYGWEIHIPVCGTLLTEDGTPVSRARIYTTDDPAVDDLTSDEGIYALYVPYGWSGTLKWDAPFCTVDGDSTVYSEVYDTVYAQNYTGEFVWCTVTGQVYTSSRLLLRRGLMGVDIIVSAPYSHPGDTTLVTSKTGNYSARILNGVSYSFWPQKIGYRMTPSMYYADGTDTINVQAVRLSSFYASGYALCGTTAVESATVDFSGNYLAYTGADGFFDTEVFKNFPYDSVVAYNGELRLRHDDYVFMPPDTVFDSLFCDTLLGPFQAREKYQFPVTVTYEAGGSVSPGGLVYVKEMTDQRFSITPDSGFFVDDVLVSDTSYGGITEFMFQDMTDTHTIHATFAPAGTVHMVTAAAYMVGNDTLISMDSTIVPSGSFSVRHNGAVRLMFFRPYFTYYPRVYVNGVEDTLNVRKMTDYRFEVTLDSIVEDKVVWVMYMPPIPMSYYITSFSSPGGTIDPMGQRLAAKGADYTYTMEADEGYYINNVIVDYVSQGAVSEYTFTNNQGSHGISVTYWKYSYPILSSAGTGGSIWPEGANTFYHGDTVTYIFAAEDGYGIDSVAVDGLNEGAVSTYTFNAVTDSHEITAYFSPVQYAIITTSGTGGSVSPAGTTAVTYFDTTTVIITPDPGYEIGTVLLNDSSVTPDTAFTFTDVLEDQSLLVSFVLKEYEVVASAGAGGGISPAGTLAVTHGDSVAFSITPAVGYDVSGILVDGVPAGADTAYVYGPVTADATVQAQFSLQSFSIAASAGAGGQVSPAGTTAVTYGDSLTVSVTPDSGYQVDALIVDSTDLGAADTYEFAYITGDHSVAATFRRLEYTVNASAGTGGSISPAGDGTVLYGDTMVYVVTPATGYDIADVLVDSVSVGAPDTVTLAGITADMAVYAAFVLETYAMVGTAGSGGTVSPAGTTVVEYGDYLEYTVTPGAAYVVADVLVDGASQGAVSSYAFSDIDTAHTLAASFSVKTFTVSASAGMHGNISPAGDSTVVYGDSILYTVTPDSGYQVADVTVDGTPQGGVTELVLSNITADHTVAAAFEIIVYEVFASAGTGGQITPSGTTAVDYGDTMVLVVTPLAGYDIADVTVDGVPQGAVDSVVLAGITADVTVAASFVLKTYEIIAAAGTGGAVTPAGTTVVSHGDTLAVSMSPATGYEVTGVSVDGSGLGALTAYTFEDVTDDHTLSASFALRTFTVTAAAGTGGSVNPAGGTAVSYGDTLSIAVTPDAGYDIADVTVGGTSQGAVDTVRLEGITGDVSVDASFSLQAFTVVATAGAGGTVSPAGSTYVYYGDSLTVAVVPDTGYDVAAVTVDGTGLGALSSYAFEGIADDHTLSATFALQQFTVTATVGTGGSVSPAGGTVVNYGDTLVIVVTPDAGYDIADVTVDGVPQGAVDTVRLEGVTADVSVHASFSITTFSIVAAAGAGGSVNPAGTTVVNYGDTLRVSITPATGYDINGVAVDGTGLGALSSYSFEGIKGDHTLSASFTVQSFTVTATAGSGGSLSPAGATVVSYGDTLGLAVTPADGYEITEVLIDSVSQGVVDTVTLEGVTADRVVHASFVLQEYAVYAAAGSGGSISPSGTTAVVHGDDLTVTVTPDGGYAVEDVLVDGVSQGAVTGFTFNDVDSAHTLTASFSALTVLYPVYAAAGTGGSISPAGTTMVNQGNNITYTITPASIHRQVADVTVDGVSQGATGTYAFTSVDSAHTILATFEDSGIPTEFPLYVTAGAGGSTSPAGTLAIPYGADTTITVSAAAGYYVADLAVDGSSAGAAGSYTFPSVTDTHSLTASFARLSYTVVAAAGAGGAVSPAGTSTVYYGDTIAVTITPDGGYAVSAVYVDGVNRGAVGSVLLDNVTAGHTISALFAAVDYVITATAGSGGGISPQGAVDVSHGSNVTFTVTPDTGYTVADVLVDSISAGAVGSYTFTGVTGSHDIVATFGRRAFSVTATAGTGGSVNPAGTTQVYYGDTMTVTVTPDSGYAVSAVYVDGVNRGAVSSVALAAITANRSVSALFSKSDYTITATAGTGGSITPAGIVTVTHGADRAFTITPDSGYAVSDVLVDGSSVGAVGAYTFEGVTGSHTISASFAVRTWTVSASAGFGGFVLPSGTSTVTHGDSLTVTVTALTGYAVSAVYVNGVNLGAVSSHRFEGITADQTLSAVFTPLTYPVAVSTGPYGSASPSGTTMVTHGDTFAVTVTPTTGFETAMLVVDGDTLAGTGSYVFAGVTDAHTLYAAFRERFFSVTAAAGAGGSISPDGDISVPYGTALPFAVTPDTGYRIASVLVDSVSVGAVSSYTFGSVTANHRIDASFARLTYSVNASASGGGSITPSGMQTVFHGDTLTYVVTPDSGYYTSAVMIDGIPLDITDTLQLADIDTAHTVTVSFARIRFLVGALTGGPGGSISPAGSVWVYLGDDQVFSITPDAGYEIDHVLLDGTEQGAVSSLALNGVDAAHTILVSFTLKRYLLRALAGSGGYISPAGSLYYDHGTDAVFRMIPDSGFSVEKVFVDGIDVGDDTLYTFTGISDAHVITVMFIPITSRIGRPVTGTAGVFVQVEPNPVSGSGVISFRVDEPGAYRLVLLDRDGTALWRMPAGQYGRGTYRLAYPGTEPGVYLLRLEGRGGVRTVKVLVAE